MSVRTEKQGPVTTVIIDHPERRNAVDRPTATALAEAFRAFEADTDSAVAVLWGAGGNFCAGADLGALTDESRRNRISPEGDGPLGPTRLQLSKPVIAAVSGYCVAGGLELACWCDLRIVEEDAVLGVFCRRFGVPLIDGGTVRLPRIVGQGRALDLILTGRPVDAREALEMGLANRLVPRGQALAAAIALGQEIARHPQLCMRGDRRSAYEALDLPLGAALDGELRHGLAALGAEAVAGAVAFSEGAGRGGRTR